MFTLVPTPMTREVLGDLDLLLEVNLIHSHAHGSYTHVHPHAHTLPHEYGDALPKKLGPSAARSVAARP